jgi:hypothetical protein
LQEPAPVKLTVGTRCIGLYQSDAPGERPAYYAGIIAEPPKTTNANRWEDRPKGSCKKLETFI